jgi:Ca2+-binding EF-hand superfamily protein
VGVDHVKTLMYYDFVNKNATLEEKKSQKELEEFSSLVEEAFREADEDGNQWLDIDECRPMCEALINTFGDLVTDEQKAGLLEKLFSWLDSDNSGRVTFHEFKVAVMRAYVNKQLPDEIIRD